MEYSSDEQMALDLDWFAVDIDGHLAHVASAGTPVAKSVAQSKAENEFVREFFRSLPATSTVPDADPEIANFVNIENDEQKSRYLSDFQSMGSRGLYSYDTPLSESNQLLFRVYSPQAPLKLSDLPTKVAVILQRTSFPGRFADSPTIKLESIF